MRFPMSIRCILPICVTVAACTSTKKIEEHTEFRTRIADSGLKHFQLALKKPPQIEPDIRRRRGEQQNARRPIQGRESKSLERSLTKVLNEKLELTQYCRDGYWLVEKSFMRQNIFIRGECNETATPKDREKFPDTIKHW